MYRIKVLTIVAVAMLAVAVSEAGAGTITVPNGDFETIYKPGQTVITGALSEDAWTQGVGPDCPIDSGSGGTYNFSDASSGTLADIHGWLGYDRDGWIAKGGTYGRDQTTGNLQGCVAAQGPIADIHSYLVNGGDWANPAGGLITSAASLGTITGNTSYALSMQCLGGAGPKVLNLLADGVVITPTSLVDPPDPVADPDGYAALTEISRTYDVADLTGYIGQSMTIVLGVGRDLNAFGNQSKFDDVTFTYCSLLDAQAVDIPVPNGRFDMYKPGTNYTVRAYFPANGTQYIVGLGDNVPVADGGSVNYADSTTGTVVDAPGWITPLTLPAWRNGEDFTTGACHLFTWGYDDETEPYGHSSALNCFGTWSGQSGSLAESAESLGNVIGASTYTLSAMMIGDPAPVTFELRAGGVAITPSSSVTPVKPTTWQVISRTYDAAAIAPYVGQPMTIRVGTTPPHTTALDDPDRLIGTRLRFDDVSLNYGPGSGTEEDPYMITDVNGLQAMNDDLDAWYELGNDINASATELWNEGSGFIPIGTQEIEFTGNFDGKGNMITGLHISRNFNFQGMFGCTGSGAEIRNVILVDADVSGKIAVGGLIGQNDGGTVLNCYSFGEISSSGEVAGGLVGYNPSGSIYDCYSNSTVTGRTSGGLVGRNEGLISNCRSKGNISGDWGIGGLVGNNKEAGEIFNCYSSGTVIGALHVGGLTGLNRGNIIDCYATGNVNGNETVGGFIGYHYDGSLKNCYSSSVVTGAVYVGGFAGFLREWDAIWENCFWDTETSGQAASACGIGKITAEMKQESTFTNWDFETVWDIIENESYPFLRDVGWQGSRQPQLKAPWRGIARISQGNNADPSDPCNSHYDHGIWDNTYAIDVALADGSDVLAPADGTIFWYDNDPAGSGGKELVTKHIGPAGDEFYMVYLHLSDIVVKSGSVKQGQVVAKSGATGDVTGAHLHFHLWSGTDNYDSHTIPIERLVMKKVGVDDVFREYDARNGDLDDVKVAGQHFESNNSRILPYEAAELAKEVIGAPYLGDGTTWGGKGYDCCETRFASYDEVKTSGYCFHDERIKACNTDESSGVDCSGLVYWAYNRAYFIDRKMTGEDLIANAPITVNFQKASRLYERFKCPKISKNNDLLEAGDLLFNLPQHGYDHVMMYIGPFLYEDNEYNVVHASLCKGIVTPAIYNFETEEVITADCPFIPVTHYGRIEYEPDDMNILGNSPIDLVVTDPDGIVVSKDSSGSADMYYCEYDLNGNGHFTDIVTIPKRKVGMYLIQVVPEPNAVPTDTYSLEAVIEGETMVLAQDVQIADIPAEPYEVESKLNCSDLDIDGDVDVSDLGVVGAHWLREDCDYPGWCGGADLNYDHYVNLKDFVIFSEDWLWEKIIADININGKVNLADFAALASYWLNPNCAELNWCEYADLDEDGQVGILDLEILGQHWFEGL